MNNNPFMACPYNPAHKVLRSRIQAHIVKCEKNYPTLEICPYNATHRFPKSELESHIAGCPSRILHVANKSKNDYVSRPKIVDQPFPKPSDPDYECWD